MLPRTDADAGVANTIVITTNYAIIGMGILMAATTSALTSALTIVFGGLSVGIGFGLQELIANFISASCSSSSRRCASVTWSKSADSAPFRRCACATVRNVDNVEIFVPNKTLLTSTVAAYTFSDRGAPRSASA